MADSQDEDDYLIAQAMRAMSHSRLATAARPRSSPGRSPSRALGRTSSSLVAGHRPRSTASLHRSQSGVAGARVSATPDRLQPPAAGSLERLWQGGASPVKGAAEPNPVPDSASFAPPPDMVFLENDLAMALSCVLRERTAPKLCVALAQAVRAYVLPKWGEARARAPRAAERRGR